MKYVGLDHVERECEGPYEFIKETVTEHEFSHDYLRIQPPLKISSDPLSAAMEVVASCPPFLRKCDCPWVLAYIDDLREFYNSKYVDIGGAQGGRQYLSWLHKIRSFALESDVVSATRMMFSLDIVHAILFGGTVDTQDYFADGNDSSWLFSEYQIQFDTDIELDIQMYERLTVDYSKSFKTSMSRAVYQGSEILVAIPDGEELTPSARAASTMNLTPGTVIECTVVRFYKTDLFWSNRAAFEYYPTFKGDIRARLQDEPLFTVEMKAARDTQAQLWGGTIKAYIPLSWITHVYHDGEYLEVGDLPTAQKTDAKLPVPMTGEDFAQFHFLRG